LRRDKQVAGSCGTANHPCESRIGSDRPKLSVIADGANGLQAIAGRLSLSSTPVLDWFHISMRVSYLEQIIKGMRARTETEKAARRVLISRVDKLRWCFWHAELEKAKTRMQGILTIFRADFG
jgi:hypothetical protein